MPASRFPAPLTGLKIQRVLANPGFALLTLGYNPAPLTGLKIQRELVNPGFALLTLGYNPSPLTGLKRATILYRLCYQSHRYFSSNSISCASRNASNSSWYDFLR